MANNISGIPYNQRFYGNNQIQGKINIGKVKGEKPQTSVTPEGSAVKIEISAEGRKAALRLQVNNVYDSALNLPERLNAKGLNPNALDFDPDNLEFLDPAYAVKYQEGTLHRFITDALIDKARNVTLIATELTEALQGTLYASDSTVAERALKREAALRSAQYIAENYFDDPNEAKAFLDTITKFADNDILREKGYIVWDNSDVAPYRNYSSPVSEWTANAMAKYFGASDEILKDPLKIISFVNSKLAPMAHYDGTKEPVHPTIRKMLNDLSKAFEENEKQVDDVISKAVMSMDKTFLDNYQQRLLKALF